MVQVCIAAHNSMYVCVCVCERERECECVCVCACSLSQVSKDGTKIAIEQLQGIMTQVK